MNKLLYGVLAFALLASPAMAGSIGGANYFDQYNILGWGNWRTLNDADVVVDADTLEGYAASDFNDYADAGDAETLATATAYTDAVRTGIVSGSIVAAHSAFADWSWYSVFSGYAFQAGNADTVDGWDASDLNRYARQRVRAERNRAEGVEAGLQTQLDNHEERITVLESNVDDLGDAYNGLASLVAENSEDIEELQGVVFEYETDKNFNDFEEKCGVFSKARMDNEADVLNYDSTFKTTANARTRNALENAVGMLNGVDENSGLTKEVCFDQIPSAFSGRDYNGDGSIDSSENMVWCVVYPAFESERAKYPCEIEKVFSSFIKDEGYVISKEATGEPKLFHITPEMVDEVARNAVVTIASSEKEVLSQEEMAKAYRCLIATARREC